MKALRYQQLDLCSVEFNGAVAEQFRDPRIGEPYRAIIIDPDNGFWRGVQQRRELSSLRASRLAPAHLGGHVRLHTHPSLEGAALVEQRLCVGIEPPFPGVLAAHEEFKADAACAGERFAHAIAGLQAA